MRTQKLIITRGYPASGKSTAALAWVADNPAGRTRANRDQFRLALYGRYTGLDHLQERTVTIAQQAAVTAMLEDGRSVIVDDTNLRLKYARAWADIAVKCGVGFEVWDIDTLADECIRRDRNRGSLGGREVGAEVIMNMAAKFRFPLPEVKPTERKADAPPAQYVPDESKPPAIIVDLDGTLAHNVTGRPMYGPGFERLVYEDDVDENVQEFVWHWHQSVGDVIFMSGRNECARDETVRWLENKALIGMEWAVGEPAPDLHLFMRADGDFRTDFLVKAELFDKHVRDHFNVRLALDDRDQVVNLWRGMGIPCWQVAEGNF